MALWRRFRISGLKSLIHHRKERFLPAGGIARLRDFRALEESFFQSNPRFCYTHFRSFVATAQVQPKPKAAVKGGDLRKPVEEDDGGVRINEAIREPEVRLVTEEGHRVVTIQEALFLARKHGLDLVEVQKKVKIEGGSHSPIFKPAVCKLMDYYKEKYKQDAKGKERKSHAAIALRNGENKEVRFKAKTEHKDLKIKAETVKRLMERGYRVKCTALHTGKDDEDLGVLLLNLLQLIEDISVVESGPHLDTKNAYIILKHIKFTSKKGNKASKAMETVKRVLSSRPVAETDTGAVDASDASNADKGANDLSTEEWETVESDSETQIESPPEHFKTKTDRHDDKMTKTTFIAKPERVNYGGSIPTPVSQTPEPPAQSNRYRSGSNGPFSAKRDGVFPGRGNQGRTNEQTRSNASHDRGQFNPKDRPARTFNPGSSPTPRYGVFKSSESSDSNAPATQPKYGIFSPSKSPPFVDDRANKSPPFVDDRTNKPTSPTPSYGIFSAPKTSIPSDDQTKVRDKSGNGSSPSPRYGNFTSLKKA